MIIINVVKKYNFNLYILMNKSNRICITLHTRGKK